MPEQDCGRTSLRPGWPERTCTGDFDGSRDTQCDHLRQFVAINWRELSLHIIHDSSQIFHFIDPNNRLRVVASIFSSIQLAIRIIRPIKGMGYASIDHSPNGLVTDRLVVTHFSR
jgi:hypothetical protein|nr:hypothetical protein [Dyella sp. ASV24]